MLLLSGVKCLKISSRLGITRKIIIIIGFLVERAIGFVVADKSQRLNKLLTFDGLPELKDLYFYF